MGISQSRESAVALINRWNSEPRERLIFDQGRDEASQYLQAVDKIKQNASEEELKQIIPTAITRLKHEFQRALSRQGDLVLVSNTITATDLSTTTITDSSSYQSRFGDLITYEAPSHEAVQYLKSIADIMDSCGQLEACIEVYISVRKPFVQTVFRKLGLDELKAGDIKRFSSEELKIKIEYWIHAANVCFQKLFKTEKQFAKDIFFSPNRVSTHEECFLKVAKDTAVNLFSFAESVRLSRQSLDRPERLKAVLTLYDAILSLTQNVDALFSLESGKGIRYSISTTSLKLGEEVRRMLSDLEDSVLNGIYEVSDDNGGQVCKLTIDAIGYIDVLMKHKSTLLRLIKTRPSKAVQNMNLPDDLLSEPQSLTPLGLHVVLIIALLQVNLENNSEKYKDASLRRLFMMNNISYIVLKIKDSEELQESVGVDYLNKLGEDVRREMTNYQNQSCERLLNCLKQEELYYSCCYTSRVSTSALSRSIRDFNAAFENLKSLHSSRKVHDPILRDILRGSMLKSLKLAYQQFLVQKPYREWTREHKVFPAIAEDRCEVLGSGPS